MTGTKVAQDVQATHTPGPWIVDEYGHVYAEAFIKHGTVVVDGEEKPYKSGLVALPYGEIIDLKITTDANARLIAAAPELLAALKDVTERFVRCAVHSGSDREFVEGAVEHARAAIAKAEGREAVRS